MEEKNGKFKHIQGKLQSLNMIENQDLYFHSQTITNYIYGQKNKLNSKVIKSQSLLRLNILTI